jgi:hypothetical protein
MANTRAVRRPARGGRSSRFRIIDEQHYGFEAPARDEALPLLVDPGLVWSSFTGGTGGTTLAGIEMARDGTGDIFLSGIASSPDFSSTPTANATSRQHSFVARVTASGNAITLTLSNGRSAVWSGACSSGGNRTKTCQFTPTADASVTANVQ